MTGVVSVLAAHCTRSVRAANHQGKIPFAYGIIICRKNTIPTGGWCFLVIREYPWLYESYFRFSASFDYLETFFTRYRNSALKSSSIISGMDFRRS